MESYTVNEEWKGKKTRPIILGFRVTRAIYLDTKYYCELIDKPMSKFIFELLESFLDDKNLRKARLMSEQKCASLELKQ